MSTKNNEVDVITLNDNREHQLVFQIRKDGPGGMDSVQCRRSKWSKEIPNTESTSVKAKEIISDLVARYEPLVRDWVLEQFKGQPIKVSEANSMLRLPFRDRNVRVWLNYSAEGALSVSIGTYTDGWKVRHTAGTGGKAKNSIQLMEFTDDDEVKPELPEVCGQIEE